MTRPASTPPKGPLILLGLMSVASLGGPFLIFLVIQGGPSPDWPPDRPIEWLTISLVTLSVVGLMLACVTSGNWSRPRSS